MHGFYAIMGGFQEDISKPGSQEPDARPLRPHILLNLAERGQFDRLNLPAAELADKSKFDVLGNLVASVQALWFCMQSIARVQQGLAISLLEVSTMAHVALSAFTLFLWWQKPQSVNRGHVILQEPSLPQIDLMLRYQKLKQKYDSDFKAAQITKVGRFVESLLRRSRYTIKYAREIVCQVSIVEAHSQSPFLNCTLDTLWMFHIHQPRELRDQWFPRKLYSWATVAFWAPVAIYGGIHISAWNTHFPTSTERIIWLIAATSVSFIAMAFCVGTAFMGWIGSARFNDALASRFGEPVRYWHLYGCVVFLAHVYLAVEAWIGLRSLPKSAFDTVDWTKVFPHFF